MQKSLLGILSLCLFAFSATATEIDSTKVYNIQGVEIVSSPKENGPMRQLPSAVSQISTKQLNDNHIVSLKGVSSLVPNFFMPDYGSRLTSAVYIRGIGSRINTPAVGMYVDNIPYVDKSAFDFNFYDIERVDVLRGPQGTLYGRNAMGGIIKVHTKNPFRYHGTDLNMSFATGDNHGVVSLTHYHQPTANFAFSAGGYAEMSRGFFKNSYLDKYADGIKAVGGRLRGIYVPTSSLKFDLSLGYDYSDEGAYPYYYTGSLTDVESYQDNIGKITNNRESRYRRGLLNAGLNIEYQAPKFVMNAITGYQNLNDRMFLDQDFLSADIYTLEQKQKINTLSEEVTFKSRNKGIWEWVSGVNLMYQTLHTTGPVTFYDDGITWLNSTINGYMPDLSAQGMNMNVSIQNKNLVMGGTFDTPTFNAALFHQSTFHITDAFSATLGLRLDYDHHNMDYNAPASVDYNFDMSMGRMTIPIHDLNASPLYSGSLKNNYLQLLPKAALKYEFNKDNNVYVSVAKGMRSGGYNVQMFSDLLQGSLQKQMIDGVKEGVFNYLDTNLPTMSAKLKPIIAGYMPTLEEPTVDQVSYNPEYSWNYELGTHLTFPEARIMMDAAVFYVDTRDQQIARFAESGLGRMMVNAGKSESYGAEMSLKWNPLEALAIMANYGYTHAKFKEYDGGNGNDYSGNYVPYVPMHTLNLDAAYTFRFNSWLNAMTIGANYTGAGKMYWTESNSAKQDFYSLIGARMTFETKVANLTLWAKNITDTKYNTFYFESASRGFEQHGKPFQIGVDLKFHF